jgi:exo-beta-1,3-glucanase (GH17 family)
MTYGVLHGLDYTFQAARTRGLRVIAILWLDTDAHTNTRSIARGIRAAKAYPETIIRLSCGSEVRTRHGNIHNDTIRECMHRLRAAGVRQPITSIDTWWVWCNQSWPCQAAALAAEVDWIGINVYPWWENKFSERFPCTTAARAPTFHVARMQNVRARYPGKEVILTEFGWPAGPKGYGEVNQVTGQSCGVASIQNQQQVLRRTFAKLARKGWSGVAFEAFREPWKKAAEGPVGRYWGICRSAPTYSCKAPD